MLYNANNTSPTALVQLTTSNGDLEHVTMRRRGTVYEGSISLHNDAYVGIAMKHWTRYLPIFISAYYIDSTPAAAQAN